MGLTQDILAKYVQNTSRIALATGLCGIMWFSEGPLSNCYACNTL